MKILMMTSLFESFDLMNNMLLSLNWLVVITPLSLLYSFWLIPSRMNILWTFILDILFKEFKPMNKYFESNLLIFITLLMFIFALNFIGLFPYIFTLTSHMMTNLSLSMSLWVGFMIFLIFNNYKKFLYHLVPLNTPIFLMNFMVLIELISNIIRPMTLAIRLTANLISGHLLMILIGNFLESINFIIMIIVVMLQNLLVILELSMSMIQAYVFSMLSMLYFNEAK
uniref:ATP synthase F0 subunit 6 n=1 Tax=Melecta chinensis TaxID=582934 RepID=UPI002551F087|nr:ATP synthase F0 subunit 6 [Melecta chinensis]WFP44654.1 ATP synthase F0 subunit 6 [Melecta chinensis]